MDRGLWRATVRHNRVTGQGGLPSRYVCMLALLCDPPTFLWQFIDDPGLRNDIRNMPVQLPLAHSGWLFKEENEETDVQPRLAGPKEEDMEVDMPAVKGTLCQLRSRLLFSSCSRRSEPA